ncbi:MAG: alcohol dehydrogenase catalytic domain-containing protein [Clostridiales Family XIII bacterium]|jgi:(R,R)-butanediol dehydrogenase/meso-butanediol dehydrogenase/diacetyl reductase|nr:alcohol dehydrogenase catalytic domain-containing protein [Clostridiales Family XIII bacterium]
MKVGVLYGKEDLRIEERPVPVPGPNQLVVKIDYAGICGTDLEFFKSGMTPAPLPMVLGHENVGTVSAVGEGAMDFKVGDTLLCGPPTACAQLCPSCRRGETNICINGFRATAGIGGPDGGYAEYYLVRDVAHTMLIKVPAGADLKEAALFDVVCVALHGVRKSRFKFGDNVVVSGTGPIGLSAIGILKAAGAGKIIALGTSPDKFPTLKAYGADCCVNPNEVADLGAEIRSLLDAEVGADVVYECAGRAASFKNCVRACVRPGGQVMVIGTIQENLDIVPGGFSIFEPNLDFSFVYTPDEVRIYLDMLKTGKLRFPDMVTDIISLTDCVEKGLNRKDRKGQLKILIDPKL